MKKIEYVIDKCYSFGSICDGPRQTSGSETGGVRIQLTHDEAMEMGEYFAEEDPYEFEIGRYDWLRETLDELLVDQLTEEEISERQEERDRFIEKNPEATEEELEEYRINEDAIRDQMWERISEMSQTWDPDLKEDCIAYYEQHIEEDD